jgi:4-amino-4-deoxy-L-arabinose transferase-like glycosyltransferase
MNLKNPTARGNFRTMILAGFLLGAATLTKPVTLYFPVILIAAWLIYRFIIKQELLFKYVLAFLLVFGLTIAPWIVRNYQVFGSVSISSSQEGALFGYLAPSVYALKYHRDFPQAQAEFFASRGLAAYPEVNGANAPYFRKLALAEIKNYPKELIKISGISLFSFFTHDGMLAPLSQMGFLSPKGLTVGKIFKQSGSEFYKTVKDLFFSPAILILIVRVLWLIISVLFFMQAIYLFIKKKFTPASSLALICVLYFALTTIANGFGVNARFRLPAEVFIFIFAFSFVFDIINRRQDHAVL